MVANAAMFAAAIYGDGALLRGCHGEYRRHPDFQFRDRGGKVVAYLRGGDELYSCFGGDQFCCLRRLRLWSQRSALSRPR